VLSLEMTMSKRPTPGVRRLEPGRYQIRAEYECPKTGLRRQFARTIRAASVAQAVAERDRLLKEVLNPTPERVRLADFAQWWLSTRLPELQASTARRYATELDRHIIPHFGDWYVDAITRDDVIAWRDLPRNLKPSSINGPLRTLKLLLRAAKHRYRLAARPDGRRFQRARVQVIRRLGQGSHG
jgi:hypothetical protein